MEDFAARDGADEIPLAGPPNALARRAPARRTNWGQSQISSSDCARCVFHAHRAAFNRASMRWNDEIRL